MSQSWQTFSGGCWSICSAIVSQSPHQNAHYHQGYIVLYCPPYVRVLPFYKTVKLWLTQAKIITSALVKVCKQSNHLFECVADLIDNIWACLHRWVWLCILLKTQRTDWPVVESHYYKGQYFFVGWAFWSLYFYFFFQLKSFLCLFILTYYTLPVFVLCTTIIFCLTLISFICPSATCSLLCLNVFPYFFF